TIRNVMMVVPVLMTSCQVFEYSKYGPVTAHTMMVPSASANASELPVHSVARRDIRSSHPALRPMIAPPLTGHSAGRQCKGCAGETDTSARLQPRGRESLLMVGTTNTMVQTPT